MTQVTRQVLYGSSWTPYNGTDNNNPRPWSYWTDLGFSDMLFYINMPGTNQSPAMYRPMGVEAAYVCSSAKAAGMNMILATKMHGYVAPTGTADNQKMPFSPGPDGLQHDWLFDDIYWNNNVLVGIHTMARWAKENGFIGVFFDEEIASGIGGWSYANYNTYWPGHTQSECEAQATVRGKSWMQAILAEFPGIEYHNYSASTWPGGWTAFSRSSFTITPTNPGTPTLQNWFYKGVAAATGYKHIYFWNAEFYGGQYHSVAGATYPYGGKVYDSWQWGSVQFDRDGCKRYWSTFFVAGTDLTKIDIVPFVAMGQIERGQTLAYQTKLPGQPGYVNDQFVPSINQIVRGSNNGAAWHGEPTKPVPLFGHYAYGQDADVWVGRNADGTPKLATGTVDYSLFRTALRAAVQMNVPVTIRLVPVTISDGLTTFTVNINVHSS